LLPLVWANSATAMPKRQKTAAIKKRRLKKADFEVEFLFIGGCGVVYLTGKPEMVIAMLGEMLKECQHFFTLF
jgi:hypothetical protein